MDSHRQQYLFVLIRRKKYEKSGSNDGGFCSGNRTRRMRFFLFDCQQGREPGGVDGECGSVHGSVDSIRGSIDGIRGSFHDCCSSV